MTALINRLSHHDDVTDGKRFRCVKMTLIEQTPGSLIDNKIGMEFRDDLTSLLAFHVYMRLSLSMRESKVAVQMLK